MAPNTTFAIGSKILLHALLWSLWAAVSICSEDDIRCLKSIKDSLDDPYGYLNSSWNFDDNREGFICRFIGVECWSSKSNQVLNIRLSAMGLKGQFPRGMEKCETLTGLDLSSNELSGPIPSNISKIFPFITSLDLSSNRFSGKIPTEIGNCSFLNILDLSNNQLTGLIPPELTLLSRLKIFRVANNQLYGPVPNFVVSFSKSSFASNVGLCGSPLEPCMDNRKRSDFKGPFISGFVIGYAAAVASVISIYMSYFAPWMHRNERNKLLRHFMSNLIWNRRSNKQENSRLDKQNDTSRCPT